MNHLNSILLEGNVCIAPKLVTTSQDGVNLVVFSMASNRYYLDKSRNRQTETLYMEVACWGELASLCLESIELGCMVRVLGRVRTVSYTSKDGSERRKEQIVARHLEYRRKRSSAEGGDEDESVTLEGREEDEACEPIALYDF